jgi:hypothetical protein
MRANRRRRLLRLASLVLIASGFGLTLGCQSYHLFFKDKLEEKSTVKESPPAAQPGAPSKYSFRLAPYVFYSDFEIRPDLPLFKELAGLRDQVTRELQLPTGAAVIQVYLFEERERYEDFIHARYPGLPNRRAFFIGNHPQWGLGSGNELLVYTFRSDRIQQDLRHELTHALLHSVLKDVPIWLDEGLAEYYELPPENDGVNRGHLDHLRRPDAPKLDLARLEAIKDISKMTAADYREAWVWTHFLLRDRPEARQALLAYLAQLRRDPDPGPLTPSLLKVFVRLDDLMDRHLAQLEPRRTQTAQGR